MGTNSEECLIINGYIMSIFLIFTLFFSKLYKNLEIQLNYSLRKIERIEKHLKLCRESDRERGYKGLPGLDVYLSENELSLDTDDSESEHTEHSDSSGHTESETDGSDHTEHSDSSDHSESESETDGSDHSESETDGSDHSEEVIDHKDIPCDSLNIKDPNNRWAFTNLF
jgi:hypothetical protein